MLSAFPALSSPVLQSAGEQKPIIVAATPLLASVISQQLAEQQIAAGCAGWERVPVFSLDAWLVSCWQEALFSTSAVPSLLSPLQESLLWQSIIEEDRVRLFDTAAMARLARRAAATIAAWQIPISDETWSEHQDGQKFLRWFLRFRARCSKEGWTTRAGLWELIPEWFEKAVCKPAALLLAGFAVLPPSLERILEQLPAPVMLEPDTPTRKRASLLACADLKAEIESAARWARVHLEASPSASLGVFIPDLQSHRSLVDRTFTQIFYPPSVLRLSAPNTDCVFHTHSPVPLSEQPLVNSALLLLELAFPRIDQASASAIIRNAFLRGAVLERESRALADLRLRRNRQLDVSLGELKHAVEPCRQLHHALGNVQALISGAPLRQSFADWGKLFADLLEAVGWPGDTELTAQEQEALSSWKEALSSLSTLGLVAAPVVRAQALSHFRRLLAATVGTSRGDLFSPIQILDSREANGLKFDAVFAAGLSDATWPPPVEVSPLIPLPLQSRRAVPGGNPASLQRERRRLTQALFATAPAVQASYADQLAPIAASFVNPARVRIELWKNKAPLASFHYGATTAMEDTDAPPFSIGSEVRGGTTIIKSQSGCPFKAFAEIRLQARAQEDGCFGFDARDRGGFLHKALEYVWRELKTQQHLKATTDAELQAIVAESVKQALNVNREGESFRQMLEAEQMRLEDLIYEWLRQVEQHRLIPFSVEDIETELLFQLGGLPLKVRIDRIDRIKNGKLVLVDYKSGKQTKNKLDCPRPAEPQLLIYAAAKGSEVEGVFFGQLRPRELKFLGKSRDRHFKGGQALGQNWDGFLEETSDEVARIAQDFVQGRAAVDPKEHACDFCTTGPFCRVTERTSSEEEDEW